MSYYYSNYKRGGNSMVSNPSLRLRWVLLGIVTISGVLLAVPSTDSNEDDLLKVTQGISDRQRVTERTAMQDSNSVGNSDSQPSTSSAPNKADNLIVQIYSAIEQQQLSLAMRHTDELLQEHPNFRLAHLIRGDLLLARAQPLSGLGTGADDHSSSGTLRKLQDLRDEAQARLHAWHEEHQPGKVPAYAWQLDKQQKHLVVMDAAKARLYVFANDNGMLRPVTDYYATQGKYGGAKQREGDKRTPFGVYNLISELPKSRLSSFYGSGAFALDYPNAWDKLSGKSGSGIWLHGSPPDTYARAPRASDGCVVLSNPDWLDIARYISPGHTPIIISPQIEWSDSEQIAIERGEFKQAFETWRKDWESLNLDNYLSHYATGFKNENGDQLAFAKHKKRVHAGKEWIEVDVSELSFFRSPVSGDMVTVTFKQDYRSNNLNNRMRKRQYWIRQDGAWKIIYEGSA